MLILAIRTDKPEAEIGLFNGDSRIVYDKWPADRRLAETIHLKIRGVLMSGKKELGDIRASVVFRGPGSFTGLRIGISVANTLADSLEIPIVGDAGEKWIHNAVTRLKNGENDRIVLPEYGAPPRITKPKH
jgi:tRNA threonylcarbamoyladenosine biosynthesis protein TsaB